MKKPFFASAVFAAIFGAVALAAGPVHAVVITGTADDFTVNWFLGAGQPDNDGGATSPIDLSAVGVFDVVDFSTTSFKLNVTITNTTVLSPPDVTEAGITTFGFGTDPNATSVSFADAADGAFDDAILQTNNQNFPGGFKNIDVCAYTQGCSGGSQGSALAAGDSDSFMLTVFGDFSGGSVTLEPFPIKFQTTAGSFEFGQVPEPNSLALLGSGLVLLGFAGFAGRARRARVRPN